ncbi:MAG: hypothetical protein LBN05_00875 [Oscillospiraceae bacterium]|jgi:hypothetical protein|nr:hypothetical protein [Oscillospiraceae bacterium]
MADPLQEMLGSLSEADMAQMRAMAAQLFGGASGAETEGERTDYPPQEPAPQFALDPAMLTKLQSVLSHKPKPDSRSTLIEAIKPHLTEPHRRKADQALGFLRAMELLPILQETGIV